jgi:hypothetical protein
MGISLLESRWSEVPCSFNVHRKHRRDEHLSLVVEVASVITDSCRPGRTMVPRGSIEALGGR